jgi:hypothetical protein
MAANRKTPLATRQITRAAECAICAAIAIGVLLLIVVACGSMLAFVTVIALMHDLPVAVVATVAPIAGVVGLCIFPCMLVLFAALIATSAAANAS